MTCLSRKWFITFLLYHYFLRKLKNNKQRRIDLSNLVFYGRIHRCWKHREHNRTEAGTTHFGELCIVRCVPHPTLSARCNGPNSQHDPSRHGRWKRLPAPEYIGTYCQVIRGNYNIHI